MPHCIQCSKEINASEAFCRHCGAKQPVADARNEQLFLSVNTDEKDVATFIGKNADKYLAKFRSFMQTGEDSYAITWHWPAFFVPFFWLLYRKLYGWAILSFFLGLVPYINIISHVVFGMTAHYIYYRRVKGKVLEQKVGPESDRAVELARQGGVNNAAVIIAMVLLAMFIAGILAAIAIPGFAGYRQRSFDLKAKQEVQDACTRCTALLQSNPEKTEITPDDLLNTGFSLSPDIDMMLLDGRRETFGLSARHQKSTKIYITDPNCRITEEQQKPF